MSEQSGPDVTVTKIANRNNIQEEEYTSAQSFRSFSPWGWWSGSEENSLHHGGSADGDRGILVLSHGAALLIG